MHTCAACPFPPPSPACVCLPPAARPGEELQEAAQGAAAVGLDPWLALQQQGVQCSEAAFVYLTERQYEALAMELQRAASTLDATSWQAAASYLVDCISRARLANSRVPAPVARQR